MRDRTIVAWCETGLFAEVVVASVLVASVLVASCAFVVQYPKNYLAQLLSAGGFRKYGAQRSSELKMNATASRRRDIGGKDDVGSP